MGVEGLQGKSHCPCPLNPFSIHFAFGQFPPEPGWGGWGSGVEMASWTDINTPPTLPTGQGPVATPSPALGMAL